MASLPCGFSRGDSVVSCISYPHRDGNLTRGMVGEVVGPSTSTDKDRVCCRFPGRSTTDLTALKQNCNIITDYLRERRTHIGSSSGFCSLRGTAPTLGLAVHVYAFGCVFAVNMAPGSQIMTPAEWAKPLPGGHNRGDSIISTVKHSTSDGSINVGDIGKVVGPSTSTDKQRVACEFETMTNTVNLAMSQLMTPAEWAEPLPGGFVRGQSCVATLSYSNEYGSIKPGDVGTVEGPSSSNDKTRIAVSFPSRTANLNLKVSSQVCTMEIFNAPLPLGYTRGDKVVTTIAYAPSEGGVMVVGDVGTVQGPSTSTDKERVSCTFNAGTPNEITTNMAKSQLMTPEEWAAPLPGGYARGDKVVSTLAHEGIKPGDFGVVAGPSTSSDKTRVSCTFSTHTSGTNVNLAVDSQIMTPEEFAKPLPGGHKVGDRIVSSIEHSFEDGFIRPGDVGKVIGFSSSADKTRFVTAEDYGMVFDDDADAEAAPPSYEEMMMKNVGLGGNDDSSANHNKNNPSGGDNAANGKG